MHQETKRGRYNAKPVTIGERTFDSLTHAWREGAVKSYGKLRERVKQSLDVTKTDLDNRERSVILNGVKYESITKASVATEITINRIHAEISRSKSRDIVLTKAIEKKTRNCIPLTLNGVLYSSTKEASTATGISQNTLQKKLKNNSSRVINYLPNSKLKPVSIGDTSYTSIAEASFKLGKCFATISKYRKKQSTSTANTVVDL